MSPHRVPAPAPPTTTPGLLRLLGVQHRCAERHLAAIAAWLERNSATAELRTSLRANGSGRLLPPPRMPVPRIVTAAASTPLRAAG